MCLGVTCHLHFWQNDWDFFTCHCSSMGMERTLNKSQHTKLTLEKKILPPLLPGFKLAAFRSQVRRSNQQAYAGEKTNKSSSPKGLKWLKKNLAYIWCIFVLLQIGRDNEECLLHEFVQYMFLAASDASAWWAPSCIYAANGRTAYGTHAR